MHFRNTFMLLAIASFVFLSVRAQAQMAPMLAGSGYYAGTQNCEMGGANALSKEERDNVKSRLAEAKELEKYLNRLGGELIRAGATAGLKPDRELKDTIQKAEAMSAEVLGNINTVKRSIGDKELARAFERGIRPQYKCEFWGEGKGAKFDCEQVNVSRSKCNVYISEEAERTAVAELAKMVDDALNTGRDAHLILNCPVSADLPLAIQDECNSGKATADSLDRLLRAKVYEVASNPEAASAMCARPQNACRSISRREERKLNNCEKALEVLSGDLVDLASQYEVAMSTYNAISEELAPYDLYTEGSFCVDCFERRFVDDRSGFRKTVDTLLPILGSAAGVYGGYKLTQEAVDRATNLGFTTNPAPSFLSYGWPMLMNGIYGGIASGIGSGMFQCANTMGGFFPGGANGMMGPYGMMGMMGQPGAFGYPFGMSPYGSMMGSPFMPGMVGGMMAGPWGMGGGLGYGLGIPQIMGMPGTGVMGMYGTYGGMGAMGMMGMPGMGGFGGGFGMMGMPGMGTFAGGVPGMGTIGGGFGTFAGGMGMMGIPGMGAMGMMGMPGGMGGFGVAGLYSVPGTMGIAGVPGLAGMGGFGTFAGGMGTFGLMGLNGSIGSSAGLLYQQQMMQQQMMQYQMQMSMMQQYQEQEVNRQRTRSQLQQQIYQLQMQMYQLEMGGYSNYGGGFGGGFGSGFGSVIGTGFGTTFGGGIYPSGVYNPGTNTAR